MNGDYTKVPLRSGDRWTAARMQQGRVLLDHEWNLNIDASVRREARGTRCDRTLRRPARQRRLRGHDHDDRRDGGVCRRRSHVGRRPPGGRAEVVQVHRAGERLALPASGRVLMYLDAFLEHVQPAEAPDELVERRSRRPTRPRAPASATAFASRPRPRRARATRGSRSRRG